LERIFLEFVLLAVDGLERLLERACFQTNIAESVAPGLNRLRKKA
jgi:hypothetical protein